LKHAKRIAEQIDNLVAGGFDVRAPKGDSIGTFSKDVYKRAGTISDGEHL
jgi:hypothetical protein